MEISFNRHHYYRVLQREKKTMYSAYKEPKLLGEFKSLRYAKICFNHFKKLNELSEYSRIFKETIIEKITKVDTGDVSEIVDIEEWEMIGAKGIRL